MAAAAAYAAAAAIVRTHVLRCVVRAPSSLRRRLGLQLEGALKATFAASSRGGVRRDRPAPSPIPILPGFRTAAVWPDSNLSWQAAGRRFGRALMW